MKYSSKTIIEVLACLCANMRDCCKFFNNSLSMTLKSPKELLIGFSHKDSLWVIWNVACIDCIDNRK